MSINEIRGSYVYCNIDGCLDGLGEENYPEKDVNQYNFLSITPIIEKPKMYEVGDLVDIAEEYDEFDIKERKNLKVVDNNIYGVCIDLGVGCASRVYLPRWAVTPHIPEQDDELDFNDIADFLEVVSSRLLGNEKSRVEKIAKKLKSLK